jgi:hypothetical protein
MVTTAFIISHTNKEAKANTNAKQKTLFGLQFMHGAR